MNPFAPNGTKIEARIRQISRTRRSEQADSLSTYADDNRESEKSFRTPSESVSARVVSKKIEEQEESIEPPRLNTRRAAT